jgi:hypothetical protein
VTRGITYSFLVALWTIFGCWQIFNVTTWTKGLIVRFFALSFSRFQRRLLRFLNPPKEVNKLKKKFRKKRDPNLQSQQRALETFRCPPPPPDSH